MTYLLNRRLFKNGVGSTLAKIECDAGCFVVGLDGLRNPESGIRYPESGIWNPHIKETSSSNLRNIFCLAFACKN